MTEEEREDEAEWFNHPHTAKLREQYTARRADQLKKLVLTASASTDLRIVAIAAHLHALDLEVKNHGGKRMAFGGKGHGRSEEDGPLGGDGGSEG